jgi:peptidoglycan hydrolase-like protein with peptidoglycan-binding domain
VSRRAAQRAVRVVAGVTAVALVAGAVLASGGAASSTSARAQTTESATAVSVQAVTEGPLASQVNDSGTLGYAAQADGSPYAVIGRAQGAYTWLPAVGDVIRCGRVLYRVSDAPVVLLCGSVPLYRSLSDGDSGPDVTELNRSLVALGYATRAELDPASDYYGAATADAVERLQDHLGVDETGSVALGDAIALPGPLRLSRLMATLGTTARPGAPVAQATSTARQVLVSLDASQQSSVHAGDRAAITLPDGDITRGRVTRVGSVASGGASGATIPVFIALDHPRRAGHLDAAPVQVQITVAGVAHALIAPVAGLLALAGGGYALEAVDARGVHRLVPVSLGLFDDAQGLVQVSAAGVRAGLRIVVPNT